ncbi:MAG: class II aldolase/adducin family protein [Rhodospirillales bacterium]|jgi:ribulose-5-phosphate 4-epimerase/fuculose-1-phosphate aldolase|nr:class II aldolase/adducin family protein [Rhodospirillales bacterium]MBT4006417.1 class II aldolase/adducin family protein [Rhodospirillales bacterium]MBT5076609.1 class II aldolase/adducin family protein [Rhodospirillales bacterium]MBT5114294.1 class II aldolase/adducin family protein [Rhodospirillales bacterium]MBT5673164.1 class II aldolase/adducin family protein [Rhodospirillales bacterium]
MSDTIEFISPPLEIDFDDLKRDFVHACRILEHVGVAQQAFNVSVRLDDEKMMAIPVTSPNLVTTDNLVTSVIKEGSPNWKAHPAIYEVCPDVGAIIHCHPPHVTAFSATSEEFVPAHHYGAPFHGKIARYTVPGQTKSESRARDMAAQLKGNRAILQQGHGVIVVGKDLHEALILTIFLEEACWTNLVARQMGQVNYLSLEESEKITPQILKQRSQDKAWNHFVERLPERRKL